MAQNVVNTDTLTPYRSLCWAMSNQLDALIQGVASGFKNDNPSNATPPAPLNQTATTLMTQNKNAAFVALGDLTALFGQPSNSVASTTAQALMETLAETNNRIFSTWSNGTTFYGALLYVPPAPPPPPVTPTGGVITTNGLYTLHTFTTSGTFTTFYSLECFTLLVSGGGGGGGTNGGGGGGAGQFNNTPRTLGVNAYPIVVGGGGLGKVPGVQDAEPGGTTSAFGIVLVGGCNGQSPTDEPLPENYANGGGGSQNGGGAGVGNPGGLSEIGNAGGAGRNGDTINLGAGGGGGGADTIGGFAYVDGPSTTGGGGGAGTTVNEFASTYYEILGGGAGGGVVNGTAAPGFGGGNGGGLQANGLNASPGTGGGGGGGGPSGIGGTQTSGGNGGSGVVVIAYLTPV